MRDPQPTTEAGQRDRPETRSASRPASHAAPEWAQRAATVMAAEWSPDRILDPGDAHDKGELSLCVGEAA